MDKLGLNLIEFLDNVAIIQVENKDSHKKILYKDLLKEILKVSILLENLICEKGCTIGIDCDKSPALISLTLGVLESACSFCYLTEEEILNNKSIKLIFTETQHQIAKLKLINSTSIFGKKIYLYECTVPDGSKFINCDANDLSKFCYSIKSSGSTGVKKSVYCTFESIASNIKALQKIFQLKKGDVIYSASPISFDVFLVDLFLSLFSGSALLIIPPHLRFDTIFFSKPTGFGATFLQITPTIFKQYGNEAIKTKILHSQSSLK
jgi:acyl-coenzyme A synthetase/AMP-(fatty) acid ligase